MLSYKEYKLLNESLYNLGIRSPEVISEPIGKTGATETLEEAKKKCMKMKKGCGSEDGYEDEDEDEDEDEMKKDVEDSEDDVEDSEESDSESEKDDSEGDAKVMMMMKKKMKKKSKKEWSDIESDLDALLEDIENTAALVEVKKGVEMIKKGMKKCNCESNMSDEYRSWWDSVNSMIGDVE